MKFWDAVSLGFEILHDVEAVLAGRQASFTFAWKGRTFTVNVAPNTGPNTRPQP